MSSSIIFNFSLKIPQTLAHFRMEPLFDVLPSQKPCEEEIGGFLGKATLAHIRVDGGKGKQRRG